MLSNTTNSILKPITACADHLSTSNHWVGAAARRCFQSHSQRPRDRRSHRNVPSASVGYHKRPAWLRFVATWLGIYKTNIVPWEIYKKPEMFPKMLGIYKWKWKCSQKVSISVGLTKRYTNQWHFKTFRMLRDDYTSQANIGGSVLLETVAAKLGHLKLFTKSTWVCLKIGYPSKSNGDKASLSHSLMAMSPVLVPWHFPNIRCSKFPG